MKDYGSEFPIINNKTDGDFIEEIAMTVASLLVAGVMVICFVLTLPACVDQLAGQTANVVAISRGIEQ